MTRQGMEKESDAISPATCRQRATHQVPQPAGRLARDFTACIHAAYRSVSLSKLPKSELTRPEGRQETDDDDDDADTRRRWQEMRAR